MEQEEIIARLDKIKFDKTKHKTIKEALKEIVESDKYAPAMRGIINDSQIMSELQDIIKAYKELQEIDTTELEEVIGQLDEEEEEVTEKKEDDSNYIEVIIDNDGENYYLKRKNKKTGVYEDTQKVEDYAFKDYDNCFTGYEAIYNYLGEKIVTKNDYDYLFIRYVSESIIELDLKDKRKVYISTDGLRKVDTRDYSKSVAKNIVKIFEKRSNANLFFNYLTSGEELPYLDYEIVSITDKYLYCVKDKEKCYFNLEGEKIITTEDYIYSDILDMKKNVLSFGNNRRHLAIVGGFDDKFNTIYGYYDLDERRQIIPLEYKEADNFTDNFTRVKDMNGKLKLLNIDEDKKIRVLDGSFLRIKDGWSYYDLHIYTCHKLNDDTYDFGTKKENGYASVDYSLVVKDLKTSFKPLYYNDRHDNLPYYINDMYTFYNSSLHGYYYLNENYEKEVLTVSKLLKNKSYYGLPEETETQELLPILKNSSFLLPIYKENKNALMCLTGQEKNELVIKDIYELSNATYTPKSKKTTNANNNDFADDMIATFGRWQFSSLIYGEIKQKWKNIPCVFNLKDGICIQNDNFVLKEIDYLENIHVEVSYGNGEKQYLLDKLGNVILGPVDNIYGPRNDMYIVTNKGKMQLYQNGVPVSYQADSISWIKKRYVSKDGIAVKSKDLLKFRNGNNIYIVDDDGEKIIKQTQDTLDLQKVLFGLEFDDLLGIEEEKEEKSYVKHK